jgi:hypothetical protein
MNRPKITMRKLVEQALESQTTDGAEEAMDIVFVKTLKDEIMNIISVGQKVTYRKIRDRMSLYYPGITTDELYETYHTTIEKIIDIYE